MLLRYEQIYWFRNVIFQTNINCLFGVSSLSLKGMRLEDAIASTREAGFDVFEFVPGVFGSIGTYTSSFRLKLRQMFEEFKLVTIHTSDTMLRNGVPVDIAAEQVDHREESINSYLEYLELAMDVGAQIVTFHPAQKDKMAIHCSNPEPYLEFADMALRYVEEEELQLGYEFFDIDLVCSIADPRFGLLFDAGHAAALFEGEATEGVLELLDRALPVVVEIHLHGVDFSCSGTKIDHLPFSRSKAINQSKIFELLINTQFSGPLVFEIGIFGPDQAGENLKYSVEAREEILASLESA